MSFGRRQISIEETDSWIFNRLADSYAARPAYPTALIDALMEAARGKRRVLDLGAGLGHVALPLAERGLPVVAVEPARRMLDRLSTLAAEREVLIFATHAKAEALPLPAAAFDLVVIADALHFLDVDLVAREVDRVLAPGGAVAVVTCGFDDTAFMRAIRASVDAFAARRPRTVDWALTQLFRLTRTRADSARLFTDATPVSKAGLREILGSISFIGPSFKGDRLRAFEQRVDALPEERVWARRFELQVARASARRRSRAPWTVRARSGPDTFGRRQ